MPPGANKPRIATALEAGRGTRGRTGARRGAVDIGAGGVTIAIARFRGALVNVRATE
jgi:hypothetical protein